MALLSFNPPPCLSASPVSSCSTSLPIAVLPVRTQQKKSGEECKSIFCKYRWRGAAYRGNKEGSFAGRTAALRVKMLQMMEQKMRMNLAKKIRLRRKRLVRKRRMRKKGRWPPSKMKKLKNV